MREKLKSVIKILPTRKYSAIHNRILFHLAWRNLITKKLRTLLTLSGVVVGIGSIFFLLSFGLGLQDLVTKQILGNQSVKIVDVTTTNSKIIKLDNDNVQKIQNLPHVEKIGKLYSFPGSLGRNGASVDTVTYGVDLNYQDTMNLKLVSGRLLTKDDQKSIVINTAAAKAVGLDESGKDAVGKSLNLMVPLKNVDAKKDKFQYDYKIVGVVSTGSGSEIYIPSFYFDTAGVPAYSQTRIVVDDTSNIANMRKSIESKGFQTASPSDTIEQVNQMFTVFNFIMIGFGSIGMLIAVLGMFNTLTISLLERTKEIGLMMTMGGRNRDMSKLFIIESLILSVIGAIIGIVLAIAGGQIINFVMMSVAHSRGVTGDFQLFAIPWWLVLGMVAFMSLVGILVAFFPAKRANSIDPIDVLRRE